MRDFGPRSASLLALTLAGAVFLLQVLLFVVLPPEWKSLCAVALVLLAPICFWAMRLRCAVCHTALQANFGPFSSGGMFLLWAVKENCPHCGSPLDW